MSEIDGADGRFREMPAVPETVAVAVSVCRLTTLPPPAVNPSVRAFATDVP